MAETKSKGVKLFDNSGHEIPTDGKEFTFSWTDRQTNEPKVSSIKLRDTLVGLYTEIQSGSNSKQTQAERFAQLALMVSDIFKERGEDPIDTEEAILARWPQHGLRTGDDGQVYSTAWQLINQMQDIVDKARSDKAVQTMRSNGTQISPGAMSNALRLMPELESKGWDDLAASMRKLIAEDSDLDPKGADMKIQIDKAYKVLGLKSNTSNNQSVGAKVEGEPSEQEPFS